MDGTPERLRRAIRFGSSTERDRAAASPSGAMADSGGRSLDHSTTASGLCGGGRGPGAAARACGSCFSPAPPLAPSGHTCDTRTHPLAEDSACAHRRLYKYMPSSPFLVRWCVWGPEGPLRRRSHSARSLCVWGGGGAAAHSVRHHVLMGTRTIDRAGGAPAFMALPHHHHHCPPNAKCLDRVTRRPLHPPAQRGEPQPPPSTSGGVPPPQAHMYVHPKVPTPYSLRRDGTHPRLAKPRLVQSGARHS